MITELISQMMTLGIVGSPKYHLYVALFLFPFCFFNYHIVVQYLDKP